MKTPTILALCSTFVFAISSSATPVTDWSIGLNNSGVVSLSNAETSSPTLGDNTADDADNTSIYAAFSSVTLAIGEKLTLSGSMQFSTSAGAAPSALANEVRVGIFDHNGASGLTGWLGYYASNPSGATGAGVRRRITSSAGYYSQTGTTLVGTNYVADTSKTFQDATYDFSLSLERTDAAILVVFTLDNDQGYSLVPNTTVDSTPNTFTFDRVGFLSGGNLNADQVQFNNLDVSVAPVPEPSTLALLACGGLAMAGYGFKRRNSSRSR